MIKYIKRLFYKKNTKNKQVPVTEPFREVVKRLQLTIDEKVELLIKNQGRLNNESLSKDDHLYNDLLLDALDITELMFDLEYIFEVEIQEGAFPLTVGGVKEYIKKKTGNPGYVVPEDELNFESPGWGWSGLANTFYNETLYSRSLAIKKLVGNGYKIQDPESDNPFKELINFTLNYFEKYFIDKPSDAERLLIEAFPIMHIYIKRYIRKSQVEVMLEDHPDEQKAYDEFLDFCEKIFCSLFPDKVQRDEQIKKHFKILHYDLIKYIEDKNK